MASFYSALSAVDTSTTNNPHAVPTPGEVSAVYRILAEAVNIIRRDVSGDPTRSNDVGDGGADPGTASAPWNSNSMDRVWESLLQEVENPPRIVKGCSQDFLDGRHRCQIHMQLKRLASHPTPPPPPPQPGSRVKRTASSPHHTTIAGTKLTISSPRPGSQEDPQAHRYLPDMQHCISRW